MVTAAAPACGERPGASDKKIAVGQWLFPSHFVELSGITFDFVPVLGIQYRLHGLPEKADPRMPVACSRRNSPALFEGPPSSFRIHRHSRNSPYENEAMKSLVVRIATTPSLLELMRGFRSVALRGGNMHRVDSY